MGGGLVGAAGPVQQPDCIGVESRGRGPARQIVPNSSSHLTLFYSVIYNSVHTANFSMPEPFLQF